MVAMGTAGLASIPYMMLVASIVPLLIGIILGNLDPETCVKCLSAGGEVTIMVLGFALGANMSLQQVAQGGVPGIVLGLITVVIGGVFNILFDKLTGGSGIAGACNLQRWRQRRGNSHGTGRSRQVSGRGRSNRTAPGGSSCRCDRYPLPDADELDQQAQWR